jgi:hypothetical protein
MKTLQTSGCVNQRRAGHHTVLPQDWHTLCQAITTAYLKMREHPDSLMEHIRDNPGFMFVIFTKYFLDNGMDTNLFNFV